MLAHGIHLTPAGPSNRTFHSNAGLWGAILAIAAAVGFGLSSMWNWGNWDPIGFVVAMVALAAGLGAALLSGRGPGPAPRRALPIAILVALVLQVGLLVTRDSLTRWTTPPSLLPDAALWLLALGTLLIVVGFVRDQAAWKWGRRALLLAGLLVGGVWAVQTGPTYENDVWSMSQMGVERLLRLQNPYEQAVTFPGFPDDTLESYPYPPIILFVQLPFYLVFGDIRMAQVFALIGLAFALIRLAERSGLPSHVADALAAVAIFNPGVFFVIGHAWTEPLNAALIALSAWALTEWKMNWATAGFAAAVFSKQFLIILAPILFLLPAFGAKRAFRAGTIAVGIALPFFLWNPERFLYGLIVLHWKAVPWLDPTTLAFFLNTQGVQWPSYAGLIAWAWVGVGVAYWRRRTQAGPWLALAASLACFFALGARAYANYYWLVAALFVLATIFVWRDGLPTAEPSAENPVPPVGDPEATPTPGPVPAGETVAE